MSETSIEDNDKNAKNHNNGNTRDDNDVVMENNEGNNIENVEEQKNDEYNDDIKNWKNNYCNDNNENNNIGDTMSQRNSDINIRNNNVDTENINKENQNIISNKNMIMEANDNTEDIKNQENDADIKSNDTKNIENWENNYYDNSNRDNENQEINDNNANIENTDKNQNNEDIMETNNNTNNEVMQTDENQDLRINFENEKIVDKIINSYIYQERKIKDKEKLNNLIKELVTEGSNILEEGIDERSEGIIKLFRKMECNNKLKQIINGYQFAKMVIKEREELYRDGNELEVAEKVNKKIWKRMPEYSYLTIRRKTGQAIKVYEMFSKIGEIKRIIRIKDFI
ncbi:unnamed protein product [Rhizophagus irregularis]|nr:unnamed protein product [Rhizophagus irregularis]